MERIKTINREIDKFGPGKDGFKAAKPGVSEATYLSAEFFNAIQESILHVIEAAGIEASDSYSQLTEGIQTIVDRVSTGLASTRGASMIGWMPNGVAAMERTVQDKLRDTADVLDYGADPTGTVNSVANFNAAILACYNRGGGVVRATGIFKISDGSVYVPSDIKLDLRGATLVGDGTGTNTLIKAGWVDAGVLKDLTVEYGTATTGSGIHFVKHGHILGGFLTDAGIGIHLHRFNFGSSIRDTWFASSLTTSWQSEQSWNLRVTGCTVYAPAIMRDFVDWTELSGNSFEGPGSTTSSSAALTITSGGYGGSYSAKIESNGFHHWATGISIETETTNLVIKNNHFENTKFHVSGGAFNNYNIDISRNWMKANLPVAGSVIPIVLLNSKNGRLGPNYYSKDGPSTFDAHVVAETTDCFGNEVAVEYSPSGVADLVLYKLNEGNLVIQRGGSNNPYLAQPSEERMSGVGAFTFEVYKRRYNLVPNQIPFCIVDYGSVVTIDTWIPIDAFGLTSRVAFNFVINGSTSYIIAGDLIGFKFISLSSFDRFSPSVPGPAISASRYEGVLRLTIADVPAGGNIAGWVKQL